MRPASSVRHRADTGWEMQCPDCRARNVQSFWPLDPPGEFWNPANMARCRACHREVRRSREISERRREYQAAYRRLARLVARRYMREYYQRNREHILATNAAYHVAHRDQINAKRRATYAARVSAQRAEKAA